MTTSVIIPTYNGAKKIHRIIDSLSVQDQEPDEIIIVIDGSLDNSVEVIEQSTTNFSNLNIVVQNNMGRAGARNSGAISAKGDLLIFFDDDVMIDRNTIERHMQHHAQYVQSLLTGGVFEHVDEKQKDIQRYKAYKEKQWYDHLSPYPTPMTSDKLFVSAANLSITKADFERLNGFDESILDAEDYELGSRAIKNQILCYFNPEIKCYHEGPKTAKEIVLRWRQYSAAHGEIGIPRSNVNLLKTIAYQISSHKIYIWMIDHFNLLKILPKSLRYFLYDIIFTGLSVHHPNRPI